MEWYMTWGWLYLAKHRKEYSNLSAIPRRLLLPSFLFYLVLHTSLLVDLRKIIVVSLRYTGDMCPFHDVRVLSSFVLLIQSICLWNCPSLQDFLSDLNRKQIDCFEIIHILKCFESKIYKRWTMEGKFP